MALSVPTHRRSRTGRQKISLAFTFLFAFGFTLLFVRAILGNLPPNVVIPPISVPTPNAFDVFLQAGKMTNKDRDALGYAVVSKPGKAWSHADKAALLARNAPALALARQGLTLPYRDASGPRSFDAQFPHYAQFRTLARLFVLEGDVKRENGDVDGAVQSYSAAVLLGHKMLPGAPLVGHLVGRACEAIGRKRLWEMRETINAQTARQAARRLQAACDADPGSFADALTEEKYWGQAGMMAFFENLSRSHGFSMAYAVWGKRDIMNNYTGYMDAMIVEAHQSYQVQPKLPPLPGDVFSQILLPVYQPSRYKFEAHLTQNNLLITALAVQAFRSEHNGMCPPTLSALVPAYLSHVPDDPLSYPVAPLRYKTASGSPGYVLYSVGPDNKDDGGAPITDYKPTSGKATAANRYFSTPTSKGDIVAGINTQ